MFLCANSAYGDGAYQRTKDGKTLVWNNHPLPGDAATWSGRRDADRYATGNGTLTWYSTEQKILTGSNIPMAKHIAASRYSGEMVRGKFEGLVVNVDANGRTFHGTFVEGRKSKDWAAGPPTKQNRRRTGIAANDQPRPDAIEHADESVAAEPPPPAEGPAPVAQPPPPASQPPASKPATTETPSRDVDDSLRSLIGQPSLLRTKNVSAEPSPAASPPPAKAESSPPAGPRLTAPEVITLANAEAQKQGHKLGEYRHPLADYIATDETWSVSYDQKANANGMAETGKHFSVSVEDKTKKTSIIPGR